MALYITNPEADRLARELIAKTGETLTDAVVTALRERLERTREPSRDERLARIREITSHSAKIIGDRKVSTDDLYDAYGLPK